MRDLSETQQAMLDVSSKTVAWPIYVYDKNGVGYAYVSEGIWSTAWPAGTAWTTGTRWHSGASYDNRVMYGFNGINLKRTAAEGRIVAPSDIRFNISNKDNALTASDFKTGNVLIQLLITSSTAQSIVASWRFSIKDANPGAQSIGIVCEDFLQPYLRDQDYPNTQYPDALFPSERSYAIKGLCIPLPFGTAYCPLRDVIIDGAVTYTASTLRITGSASGADCIISDSANGLGSFEQGKLVTISGFTDADNNGTFRIEKGGVAAGSLRFPWDAGMDDEAAGDSVTISHASNYIVLGPPTVNGTAVTYSISEVRNPKQLGDDSTFESGSYAFQQSTRTDQFGASWRTFQAIIADIDEDGTAESPGSFGKGGNTYDPLVKFSRSDTIGITNPADFIRFLLLDFGVPSAYIDTVSFGIARAIFTGLGLTFNGAYWYKQPREKILAEALVMCHSTFRITDKVELHVLSKTSRKTITKANVYKPDIKSPGTFRYTPTSQETKADAGFIVWQKSGEPVDQLLRILVPADAGADSTAFAQDVIECPFVQDSQDVQRIGTLSYQRKLTKQADVFFTGLGNTAALQPDDVITIDHADYGGTYDVLIESMKINKNLLIDYQLAHFSVDLDDWEDFTPGALTIPADDSHFAWTPTISGPQSDTVIGQAAFGVWGQEWIKVGPNPGRAQFTDIQLALNAVRLAGSGAIYILNGEYLAPGSLYVPDVDIKIEGQSRGGVILKNLRGSNLFDINDRTKTYSFSEFTVTSQNIAVYSYMFHIHGTTAAQNTSKVTIKNVDFVLADSGAWQGEGDAAVYGDGAENGKLLVADCLMIGGKYGVYADTYDGLTIRGTTVDGTINSALNMISSNNSAAIQNIIKNIMHFGILNSGDKSLIAENKISFVDSGGGEEFKILYGIAAIGTGIRIASNGLSCITSTSNIRPRMIYVTGNENLLSNNEIEMNLSTSRKIAAIDLGAANDCVVTGHRIKMDNDDTSDTHIGISLNSSDRNVIALNEVDGINNDANDYGIVLDAASQDNQGGDNLTYRVGTGIVNNGGGTNAVTGKDV